MKWVDDLNWWGKVALEVVIFLAFIVWLVFAIGDQVQAMKGWLYYS